MNVLLYISIGILVLSLVLLRNELWKRPDKKKVKPIEQVKTEQKPKANSFIVESHVFERKTEKDSPKLDKEKRAEEQPEQGEEKHSIVVEEEANFSFDGLTKHIEEAETPPVKVEKNKENTQNRDILTTFVEEEVIEEYLELEISKEDFAAAEETLLISKEEDVTATQGNLFAVYEQASTDEDIGKIKVALDQALEQTKSIDKREIAVELFSNTNK